MSAVQVISLKSFPPHLALTTKFELGGSPCLFLKEKVPTKIFSLSPVFNIIQVGKGLKGQETNYSSYLLKALHWVF